MKPADILNGLSVFRYHDSTFVRRLEKITSKGLPIKMWLFQPSEKDFDAYVFAFS